MLRLGFVEIVESGLEENSLGGDLVAESIEHAHDLSLFVLVEQSGTLGLLDNSAGVGKVREDSVDVVDEGTVLDETGLALDSVLVDEVVNLVGVKPDIQSADTGTELNNKVKRFKPITYSSFADPSFAEFVEIQEELLDSDSVLGSECLEFVFNIILGLQFV